MSVENNDLLEMQAVREMVSESWMLVYTYDKVHITTLSSARERKESFFIDDIIEARVFNENEEFKLWRIGERLGWRKTDSESHKDAERYREEPLLWGNRIEKNSLIEEGKGMVLDFPCDLEGYRLPLRVVVENYYRYDENGAIRFFDARLVRIADGTGRPVCMGH